MKKTILAIFAFCIVSQAFAQQSLRSAYFMDGYNGRSKLNPAFAAERSYFSVPSLGGFGFNAQSNLGVNTFLYPVDGGLTTFMSSSVSADEFLGKLKKNNKIGISGNTSLLSLGIWGKRAFFTFDISEKMNVNANLPYSIFDFMKNAGASQYYDISNLAVNADSRLEFAFGYSRRISDMVNFGARLKFLVGVGNADARIDKMHVQMTGDRWAVTSRGTVKASMGLLDVKTKGEAGASVDSPDELDIVDKIEMKDLSDAGIGSLIGGYGAAIDLGAEAELIPGLKVSLALNDIGVMSWRHTTVAETGDRSWYFDGFDNVSFDGDKDNSISEQFKDLGDDLADLAEFHRTKTDASHLQMIAMTLNAGAEYTMPFYGGLTAGILSSTRINGPHTWSEGRLYANLKPCTWFSFGMNYALSSFGSSMGAVLGFHTTGFSMFIGSDNLCFRYAKAAEVEGFDVPYPYGKLRLGLNFGISFNVGRRHSLAPSRPLIDL